MKLFRKLLFLVFLMGAIFNVHDLHTEQETKNEDVKTEALTELKESISDTLANVMPEKSHHTSQGTVSVTFVDVGQGDCIVIEDAGDWMVIDTGKYSAYDNVQDALKGCDQIDVLVLTHPDADHIQSASDLIEDYGVDEVWMPDIEKDTQTYDYLLDAVEKYDVDVVHPSAGDKIKFGTADYTILGPVKNADYTNSNSYSLILKLINGQDEFLFAGDATGEEIDDVLSSGFDVSADVFKAAHHGSANDGCNSWYFYNAVDPEAVIISCGYQNNYGHPHVETMEMIKNDTLFRTDLQGSIECISTGEGVEWGDEPSTNYKNGNAFN